MYSGRYLLEGRKRSCEVSEGGGRIGSFWGIGKDHMMGEQCRARARAGCVALPLLSRPAASVPPFSRGEACGSRRPKSGVRFAGRTSGRVALAAWAQRALSAPHGWRAFSSRRVSPDRRTRRQSDDSLSVWHPRRGPVGLSDVYNVRYIFPLPYYCRNPTHTNTSRRWDVR